MFTSDCFCHSCLFFVQSWARCRAPNRTAVRDEFVSVSRDLTPQPYKPDTANIILTCFGWQRISFLSPECVAGYYATLFNNVTDSLSACEDGLAGTQKNHPLLSACLFRRAEVQERDITTVYCLQSAHTNLPFVSVPDSCFAARRVNQINLERCQERAVFPQPRSNQQKQANPVLRRLLEASPPAPGHVSHSWLLSALPSVMSCTAAGDVWKCTFTDMLKDSQNQSDYFYIHY